MNTPKEITLNAYDEAVNSIKLQETPEQVEARADAFNSINNLGEIAWSDTQETIDLPVKIEVTPYEWEIIRTLDPSKVMKYLKIAAMTTMTIGFADLLLSCQEKTLNPIGREVITPPVNSEKFVPKTVELSDIGNFNGYFDSAWYFIPTSIKMNFTGNWNASKTWDALVSELKNYIYVDRLSIKQNELLTNASKLEDLQALFDTESAAGLVLGITISRGGTTYATYQDSFTKVLSVNEFKNFSLENIPSILIKMNEWLMKKSIDFQIIKISKWLDWKDFIELVWPDAKFDLHVWVTWLPWLKQGAVATLGWLLFGVNGGIVWYKWWSWGNSLQLWSQKF